MGADFKVRGVNPAARFNLTVHRGDGMCLLAMDWKDGEQLYPGQEDTKFGKKSTMELYLDEKSLIRFRSSGSRTKLHMDDSGLPYIKLSRNVDQVYKDDPLGNPLVVTKDKDGNYVAFDKMIGNGSKVIAKVSVYDSKFGPGTRWEALEIVEHTPYEALVSSAQAATALADGKYKF